MTTEVKPTPRRPRILLATAVLLILSTLLVAGCDDNDGRATPSPSIASSPTIPASPSSSSTASPPATTATSPSSTPTGLYPLNKRVSDPKVDNFLELLERRDGAAIGKLIRPTELPCGGSSIVEPSCSGKPVGTKVTVVPTGACQPLFVSQSEAATSLSGLTSSGSYYVYAIYSKPDEFGPPPGQYTIVLATGLDGDAIRVILDESGNIVRYNATCGNPPSRGNLVPDDARVILAPNSH